MQRPRFLPLSHDFYPHDDKPHTAAIQEPTMNIHKSHWYPCRNLRALPWARGQRSNTHYTILFRECSSVGKQMCVISPSKYVLYLPLRSQIRDKANGGVWRILLEAKNLHCDVWEHPTVIPKKARITRQHPVSDSQFAFSFLFLRGFLPLAFALVAIIGWNRLKNCMSPLDP